MRLNITYEIAELLHYSSTVPLYQMKMLFSETINTVVHNSDPLAKSSPHRVAKWPAKSNRKV